MQAYFMICISNTLHKFEIRLGYLDLSDTNRLLVMCRGQLLTSAGYWVLRRFSAEYRVFNKIEKLEEM